MRYQLSLNLEGEAVNQDGRLRLQLAGSPPRSTEPWRLAVNCGGQDPSADASAELRGPMDGVLNGGFASGNFVPITDADGRVEAGRIDMSFRVNESAGGFAGSTGTIRLYGTIEARRALLSADLDLDAPVTAWRPPAPVLLSDLDAAAGADRSGQPPGTQMAAERGAESTAVRHTAESRNPPSESRIQRA
jgi:hypothetical protein